MTAVFSKQMTCPLRASAMTFHNDIFHMGRLLRNVLDVLVFKSFLTHISMEETILVQSVFGKHDEFREAQDDNTLEYNVNRVE